MDVHHQASASSFAPVDTERATIAMRLVMMCVEFLKTGEPEKALEAYHHARDILDGLASSPQHNVDLGLTLSLLHLKIGDLMRAAGTWARQRRLIGPAWPLRSALPLSIPATRSFGAIGPRHSRRSHR